jgi:hypothetical protein
LVTSERVTAIKNVISKRSELSQFVSGVLASIPEVFSIESVNASLESLALSVSSDSLSEFDNLLSDIIPKVGKKTPIIKTIEISSFTQHEGAYTLGLNFMTAATDQK